MKLRFHHLSMMNYSLAIRPLPLANVDLFSRAEALAPGCTKQLRARLALENTDRSERLYQDYALQSRAARIPWPRPRLSMHPQRRSPRRGANRNAAYTLYKALAPAFRAKRRPR